MDNYVLSNCIKKELRKRFKESEIKKRKINLKYINSLLQKYQLEEFCESWYDFYEETCTWQDVEFLRGGWIGYGMTCKDRDKLIKKVFYNWCKYFDRKCSKRNIFIAENKKYVWIVLPLRNIEKEDVYMILKK